MKVQEIRERYNLSQQQAANIACVPLRTYVRYDTNESYGSAIKRAYIIEKIESSCKITEEFGVLSIEQIKTIVKGVFDKDYAGLIECCYLFGSYAKGYAKGESDVDLCVSTELTGLKFVGLIEELRQALNKKVDLIRLSDLNNNIELVKEIMKDGVKIYG